MSYRMLALACALFLPAISDEAKAQSQASKWDRSELPGAFTLSLAFAVTDLEVTLNDTEIVLPESFDFGDFETTVDEDVTFSSTFIGAGAAYRVLPVLTLNARAGFVSSESDIGVGVSGIPDERFPGVLVQGPVSFATEVSTSVEGINAGIGATLAAPLASIGSREVIGYATYQHSWSEYSDDNFSADYGRAGAGLVFPFSLMDPMQPVFRLGASYTDVNRQFEREFVINGETASVITRQGIDNPFAIELGAVIPAARNVQFSLGASIQTTGNTSFLASLTFQP